MSGPVHSQPSTINQSCNWDGSQTAPTLTANNAGGQQRMPDKDNFNAVLVSGEITGSLMASGYEKNGTQEALNNMYPVISYGLDRASFNQGQNAKFNFSVEEELAPTIISKGAGGVLTRQ